MTYSITTSFFNNPEAVQKGTVVADVVIVTALVVVGALTLLGYFAQLQVLAGLAVLYPIAAYSMIAGAVVVILIDLAVYCVKKHKANKEISIDKNPHPNDIEASSLTEEGGAAKTVTHNEKSQTQTNKELNETLQARTENLVEHFYHQFGKKNSPPSRIPLSQFFFEKVNAEKKDPSDLHALLPEFLADYYDIDIDVLRKVIFDENQNLTKDVLELALELFGKIQAEKDEKKSVRFRVERQIKAAIKTTLKVTEIQTPIALTDWDAISLRHLIFLSDGCFYDLSPGDDLIYLKAELGDGGKRRSPVKLAHTFTDEDAQKFERKIKKLGINLAEAKRPEVEEKPKPFPYASLINMIEDLVITPDGGIEAAMTPYVEDVTHPDVQQLVMPNYQNKRVSEVMYRVDMHEFALCLWNAIVFTRRHHMPRPSQALINAAHLQGITLYTF